MPTDEHERPIDPEQPLRPSGWLTRTLAIANTLLSIDETAGRIFYLLVGLVTLTICFLTLRFDLANAILTLVVLITIYAGLGGIRQLLDTPLPEWLKVVALAGIMLILMAGLAGALWIALIHFYKIYVNPAAFPFQFNKRSIDLSASDIAVGLAATPAKSTLDIRDRIPFQMNAWMDWIKAGLQAQDDGGLRGAVFRSERFDDDYGTLMAELKPTGVEQCVVNEAVGFLETPVGAEVIGAMGDPMTRRQVPIHTRLTKDHKQTLVVLPNPKKGENIFIIAQILDKRVETKNGRAVFDEPIKNLRMKLSVFYADGIRK